MVCSRAANTSCPVVCVPVSLRSSIPTTWIFPRVSPEGIAFKQLPDYREELTAIYVKLKPMGMTVRTMQSIEDVTNPMLNSINEKCARIRAAFIGQFDDYMAKSYYVDGQRGEAKKISLPRDLVAWE